MADAQPRARAQQVGQGGLGEGGVGGDVVAELVRVRVDQSSPRCDIPGSLQMPGSGLVVTIDHGQGIATLYAHASVLAVTAGQSVQAGEVIAWVGSTGHSTGNHLHFQVHMGHLPVDGATAQDPEAFLRSVGIEP